VTILFALLALNVVQTVLLAVIKCFHAILHKPDTQIKVLFAAFPKMRTFKF